MSIWTPSYQPELYHFGVKGMKWGVRKDRDPVHRRTRTIYGAKHQDKTLNRRHRIKAGTKLYRMTTAKEENNSGTTYVTYQDSDRDFYRKYVTHNPHNSGSKYYEKTYTLNEDLVIPSRDEVREAYSKAIKDIGRDTVTKALNEFVIGGRVIGGDIKKAEKDYKAYKKAYSYVEEGQIIPEPDNSFKYYDLSNGKKKIVGSITSDEWFNGQYYESAKSAAKSILSKVENKTLSDYAIGMGTLTSNPKLKERIIKSLSAKGYNAIVDEAGVGTLGIREGQEPLIIFDRSQVMTERKTREYTRNDVPLINEGYTKASRVFRSLTPTKV